MSGKPCPICNAGQTSMNRYVYRAWAYCPHCGVKLWWTDDGVTAWRGWEQHNQRQHVWRGQGIDVGQISPKDMRP